MYTSFCFATSCSVFLCVLWCQVMPVSANGLGISRGFTIFPNKISLRYIIHKRLNNSRPATCHSSSIIQSIRCQCVSNASDNFSRRSNDLTKYGVVPENRAEETLWWPLVSSTKVVLICRITGHIERGPFQAAWLRNYYRGSVLPGTSMTWRPVSTKWWHKDSVTLWEPGIPPRW